MAKVGGTSPSRLSSERPVSKGPVITLKKKKVENKPSATKAAAVKLPEENKQQAVKVEEPKKVEATKKVMPTPAPVKKAEPVVEEKKAASAPVKKAEPVVEEKKVASAPVKKAEPAKVEEPKKATEEKATAPAKKIPPKRTAPVKQVVVVKRPTATAEVKTEPKPVKPVTAVKVEAKKPVKADEKKVAKTVYHVSKRDRDGREWKVFIQGSTKVIKLFATQKEALDYAKTLCKNKDDGSYVLLHGLDGKIRKF